MKISTVITNIFLASIILLSFSCKKEVIEKPNNTIVTNDTIYNFMDIDWTLASGRLYVQNLDNGSKTLYDHFGSGQNQSSLDPFNSSAVPFDDIVKGVTTWRFTTTDFILNSSNFYNFTHSGDVISVIGLENGSSRPLTIININNTTMTVKLNEDYLSSGGVNYKIFTTLTFVKQGNVCNGCEPNAISGYVYQGVFSNGSSTQNDIVGTKWVVTKFYDGFSNNYPNDTLYFVNNTQYTINSGTPKSYNLTTGLGSNMTTLNLYGFYTIGGDYSGMVPNTFVSDGQINSVSFTDLFGINNNKLVWMTRIQ
jgi:hypothetical protein